MPPKKKKEPKNAYFIFMTDYRDRMRARGKTFRGMAQVAEAASPIWERMSAEEKAPYEEQARIAKKLDKEDLNNKFTTLGISYAQIQREERERAEKKESMDQEIKQTVQTLDIPKGLKKCFFYVIHMNYMCHRENTYYPREIAIARFNLEEGVCDAMHSFIEHSDIPAGYAYQAKSISTETHEIPLPDPDNRHKNFVDDYMTLLIRIESFMKVGRETDDLPPLYTMESITEHVASMLEFLQEKCGAEENKFRVYPLPNLFFKLREASASFKGGKGFPELTVAQSELTKDVFDFSTGIACEFHEPRERKNFCSLSIVHSWCFLICDYCCQDLDIELIPGQHVPLNSIVGAYNNVDYENFTPTSQEQGAEQKVVNKTKTKDDPPPILLIRPPHTMPIALNYVEPPNAPNEPNFTPDDFPLLGEKGGVFGNLPLAVAGRGRGRGRGRGQKLAASFKGLSMDE